MVTVLAGQSVCARAIPDADAAARTSPASRLKVLPVHRWPMALSEFCTSKPPGIGRSAGRPAQTAMSDHSTPFCGWTPSRRQLITGAAADQIVAILRLLSACCPVRFEDQRPKMPSERPVIIAGGGPVGVLTALALARQGLEVRLFEADARVDDSPRAATTHAATLEM